MRFIHMADVHLGAKPDQRYPWSTGRDQEIWETFRQVIEQAGRRQANRLAQLPHRAVKGGVAQLPGGNAVDQFGLHPLIIDVAAGLFQPLGGALLRPEEKIIRPGHTPA